MAESNSEIARRGYDAVLRGDLDAVAGFLDPDVRWHGGDPDAPGACRNRKQALRFMRQARERRAVGELVDVIEVDDRVVVIMRLRSGPAEGTRLTANVTTLRDGMAIEIVHYARPEDALAAVGISGP